MSGEKGGKNLLLKIDNGAGTYTTLGGLRSKSMTLNAEAIDVTNHGSNEWKELLDGAGVKSMSISGSGVFNTSTTLSQAITDWAAQTLRNFQIVDADSGLTFQGAFKITSMERAGEYNGEQTWSMSMESSGTITIS